MTTTLDLRDLDAPQRGDKPTPDFQPADAMDVQNAREVITRMRIKRLAEGYERAEAQKRRRP